MGETCAVCKKGQGPEKCEVCGFSDNGFINRQFPIPEDAKNWIEKVVIPYRVQWEAKKREAELLAQLEAAKSAKLIERDERERIRKSKREEREMMKHTLGTEDIGQIIRSAFITDPRDGKVYRTVKIGEQVWLAENLAYNAPDSKCYDNDESNGKKYGRLYDWNTAMKACPAGWHLPSNEEWQTLVDFAGGEKIAGKKLKSYSGWNVKYGNVNGTDDFYFSALPGGYYHYSDGSFYDVGYGGIWWSSSESDSSNAYYRYMDYDDEAATYSRSGKSFLYSVRCIKD